LRSYTNASFSVRMEQKKAKGFEQKVAKEAKVRSMRGLGFVPTP
jgi:hypothetical protein